jgi:hypothetical protein
LKKIIFTLIVCATALAANAQIGYNYMQYDFGVSASSNSTRTDYTNSSTSYAFTGHFTYNYTPYINYIAELQVGAAKGDSLNHIFPGSALTFINNYTSLTFRAQFQAGEILDYSQSRLNNVLKNFYISGGVGIMFGDVKVYNTDTLSAESKSSYLYFPLKLGYEFKLFNSYNEPWAKIDIGYQYNYVTTDTFDGIVSGRAGDSFSQLSIGVKFGIGGRTSYRKSISY